MPTLDRKALATALDRFSRVQSVLASDRVCLAGSQGNPPDLRGRAGFILHASKSSLPWFLRPLGILVASRRCLVELTLPTSAAAFAQAADDCFTVSYYSFPRALLPSVLSRLQSGSWDDALGIAHRDPTYAELEFCCDIDDHDRVLVFTRGNRDCPADLVQCFREIEDA
jgi:hypothetical protein